MVTLFFIYSRIGIRTHLGGAEQNRCRRQSEATSRRIPSLRPKKEDYRYGNLLFFIAEADFSGLLLVTNQL